MMTKVFELKKMAPRIRIFPLASAMLLLSAGGASAFRAAPSSILKMSSGVPRASVERKTAFLLHPCRGAVGSRRSTAMRIENSNNMLPGLSRATNGCIGASSDVSFSSQAKRRYPLVKFVARKTAAASLLLLLLLLSFALLPLPAIARTTAAKAASAPIVTSFPLVKPTDEWSLWFAVLATAAFGIKAEKYKWGAALSAPLVTMFTSLCLTNVGVLPTSSAVYSSINHFVVPLAVPMLLFGADLRRVLKDTGRLLAAFVVGAIATVTASVIAAALVPMKGVMGGWKIAAALCSRHIGGAINYVAVSDVLSPPPAIVTAGIAADNVVVAAYFIAIFAMANSRRMNDGDDGAEDVGVGGQQGAVGGDAVEEEGAGSFTLSSLSGALAVSSGICWLASRICTTPALADWSIPIATLITIVMATAIPDRISGLKVGAEAAGVMGMQLFFAATGASGNIKEVLATAPALFLHSAVQVGAHLAIVLFIGRLTFNFFEGREKGGSFRESRWWNQLLLASNANVGGPTTAAGMASAKGWRSLVVPAILVGVLGYAVATFVSVLLGRLVLVKLMS